MVAIPPRAAPAAAPVAPARPGLMSESLARTIYEAAGLAANERTPAAIIGESTYQTQAGSAGPLAPGETRALRVMVSGNHPLVILSALAYGDQAAGFLFSFKSSLENAPIVSGAPLHSLALFGGPGVARDAIGWRLPRPLSLPHTAYLTVDVHNLSTSPQHVWFWFQGFRAVQ